MRNFSGVLAALALVAASASVSAADSNEPEISTGNGLLKMCSDSANNFEAGQCVGFLVATIATGQFYSEKPYFCLPAKSTLGQSKDVIVQYLRDKPESRHLSSSLLVIAALSKAWPCPPSKP